MAKEQGAGIPAGKKKTWTQETAEKIKKKIENDAKNQNPASTKEYQKLPSKPSSSNGKSNKNNNGEFGSASDSGSKNTKQKIASILNSGLGETSGSSDNSTKIDHTNKPTKLTGDGSTQTANHDNQPKTGAEKAAEVPTTGATGNKNTQTTTASTSTGSSSSTGTKTATESKIEVPLKEVEQATRREAEKVQSYDPYADDQYNRQLEEYRQSIAGAYERQREESDLAYDRNKSAADRAALARGMGRSSYNLQTMANIDTEKAKARQTISDKEEEAAQQFGVQLASELRNNYQWETAQNYQRDRDTWNDYFQQQSLNQNQQSLNMQAQQNAIANQQADRAYNYQVGRDQTADQQWQQSFNYQQQRDTVSDEQWQKTFGYQQQRDTVADEQWQKTFEQNQKIADQGQSNTEKQIALGLLQSMAQTGGNPSDSLLKAAGIKRKDYNAMKKKTSKSKSSGGSGGSGSGGSGSGGGTGGTGGGEGSGWFQTLMKWFS